MKGSEIWKINIAWKY